MRNLVGYIFCFLKKVEFKLKRLGNELARLKITARETQFSLNSYAYSGGFPKLSGLLCRSTNKRFIVRICKLYDIIEIQAPIGITVCVSRDTRNFNYFAVIQSPRADLPNDTQKPAHFLSS